MISDQRQRPRQPSGARVDHARTARTKPRPLRGTRTAAARSRGAGQSGADVGRRPRARLAGQAGRRSIAASRSSMRRSPRPTRCSTAPTRNCAQLAEAELPELKAAARSLLERAARHDRRRRGRQPHALHRGNPRRHRRRRGGPVRPRSLSRCTSTTPKASAGRSKSST